MTAHTVDALSLDYLIELGDTGHGRRRNLILAPRGLRWCSHCRRPVDIALFSAHSRSGDLLSWCRPCRAAEQRVKMAIRRGRELPETEAPMHPPIEIDAPVPNGCVVRHCQGCGGPIDGFGLKPGEYRARVYCSIRCLNTVKSARASAARAITEEVRSA